MIQAAAFISCTILTCCLLAAALASVRYAIQVKPAELDVRKIVTLFAVCLVLAAAIFFMWRV